MYWYIIGTKMYFVEKISLRILGQCAYNECIVKRQNIFIKMEVIKEWLEFIKENRSKGGLRHNYDVVIGPVADDNTMETVQLYIANILTASEAVERL